MNSDAIKDLLLRVADDELIIAHRHSEWTGLGPLLEEDIAFSSIAQDKLGHAQALYSILHEKFSLATPDEMAFMRSEVDLRCCHLVELPNQDYAFSLMRHFLYDAAEYLRYSMLTKSTFEPLAQLARKVHGEIKYHLYHATTWVVQLGGNGTTESHDKMQRALDEVWPFALGMFEHGPYEEQLKTEGIFNGEDELKITWLNYVKDILNRAALIIPADAKHVLGGRHGYHTEYMAPLLLEMTEVYRTDPAAEW
ncbi:MAG: phenylacetate-CoA oxygenase subunit PaaC [Ignavibacteria bacterium]|nr:phenylacetate-CoA oxygenase subunit PaaC [Ignavibacteria bacterium]